MNRTDHFLVSSILFAAIKEGEAEPKIALRFAQEFAREAGRSFSILDFVNRCVPQKRRAELGKVIAKPLPPEPKKEPVQIEDNAALFTAILRTEFPRLAEKVSCALTMSQQSRFTIGRVGSRVWIRFGGQALSDPIGAVRAAAPDAEAMALGQTAAREIVGR